MKTIYVKPSKPLAEWSRREVRRDALERIRKVGRQYGKGESRYYEFNGIQFSTKAELAPAVYAKWQNDWHEARQFVFQNNLPVAEDRKAE